MLQAPGIVLIATLHDGRRELQEEVRLGCGFTFLCGFWQCLNKQLQCANAVAIVRHHELSAASFASAAEFSSDDKSKLLAVD